MTTSKQFVERYIGQGAYGEVYELIGHEPPAVIKYMLCGNAQRLKIFKNECEALKKIYHVNVVRLYRYTEEGIKVGIVMEYCQKGPLKEVIIGQMGQKEQNGVILDPTITYSMNTVLTWGIQLFDAIDHLYQKHKSVHRDIKPDNIFVTNEYQLKIGDFGLVKVVGDRTIMGTFAGTDRYMSPPEMKEDGVQRDVYEQVKEADVFDSHRNDVYSLGLVMWEIIERRNIFANYEKSGVFDRDLLLIDIALKRVTEVESPECQSEIQKIILRCTNFQRIERPPASEVLDSLKQTEKANQFISSLDFMPTEDKNQKELMKPIGFDDRTEWVMVESEERKYEKRFQEENTWRYRMQGKLRRLNSAEREKFFKEAPNIVSRLKKETKTFKDARYVIYGISWREEEEENLHEKDIYEIFELLVLEDFQRQAWEETFAFTSLKSHEEIWISSFQNWRWLEESINVLKETKRGKYTTNFCFRCFISQLTGEGWIHIEMDQFRMTPNHVRWNAFVSEDLRLLKLTPGRWVENPRAEIWSYEIENEDKKHELLHFSHYQQIPLERIIEACEKQQKRMETIIEFNLKYLIPIEDLGKNNVQFDIKPLLDESSEYERFYGPHPFPHYLFQLRNPPRPICQKNHLGKCQMDGFRKLKRWSDLPNLHMQVCGKITKYEVLVLDSYMDCLGSVGGRSFHFVKHPFLFICCQNLLDIPFLILLDHPNNYENGESIPGFDLKKKLHHIDVGVLREYFQESKLNERVYALIKSEKVRSSIIVDIFYHTVLSPLIEGTNLTEYIRLIDYQGNPKTEWLGLEKVAEVGFR